jgi:hypothetical protein
VGGGGGVGSNLCYQQAVLGNRIHTNRNFDMNIKISKLFNLNFDANIDIPLLK